MNIEEENRFFNKLLITKLTDYYLDIITQIPINKDLSNVREFITTAYNRNKTYLVKKENSSFEDIINTYVQGRLEILESLKLFSDPSQISYDIDDETIHDLTNININAKNPQDILMKAITNID